MHLFAVILIFAESFMLLFPLLDYLLLPMSYEDRYKFLDWPTLSIRRDYLHLIDCYKIVFGISENINFSDYFELSKLSSTRSNHSFKLYVKPARVNCYKHSFFIRIVKLCNSLSTETVEAEDIGAFKRILRLHLGI